MRYKNIIVPTWCYIDMMCQNPTTVTTMSHFLYSINTDIFPEQFNSGMICEEDCSVVCQWLFEVRSCPCKGVEQANDLPKDDI